MVDFKSGRARAANYQNICETIADSYPEGLAHGVQKDGIQNAFDARVGRSSVMVRLSLIENPKGTCLTIADSNTTGLTGPVVESIADYETDLPADHHWG